MNRPTKIYVLIDPRNGEVRYVGKTVRTLTHRLNLHISESKRKKDGRCKAPMTHKDKWLLLLLATENHPLIELIENVNEKWEEREIFWISHYKSIGANLVNTTNGGEGALGFKHSDSFKKWQSARASFHTSDPKWRQSHSEKIKARYKVPGKREEQSAIIKKTMTPERRLSMSIAMKKRTSLPEWKERMREIGKSAWSTPEKRAKMLNAYAEARNSKQLKQQAAA